MRMHNPPHPGRVLKDALEGLAAEGRPMSVAQFAAHIGVARSTVHRLLACKAAITPDMSIRLAEAFGQPTVDIWLRMQMKHDLWQAEHSKRKKVKPLRVLPPDQRLFPISHALRAPL